MAIEIIERKRSIVILENKKKKHVLKLNPDELAALVRWGIDKAHAGELAKAGPFVVTAPLEYSDFGEGDQDTMAYNWAVRTGSKELADQIVEAVNIEIKLAGFKVEAEIPVAPELEFNVSQMEEVISVPAALQDLRMTLFDHQSDSVAHNEGYWTGLGFSKADADEIDAQIGDYRWNQKRHEFDPEEFLRFVATHSALPGEILYRRLARWVCGASIEELKSIKE